MTSDATNNLQAQQAAQMVIETAAAARRIAELAASQHDDVLVALADVKHALDTQGREQAEMRNDLRRIEGIATEAGVQAKLTNGRVSQLDLWRAEMKGVAQGAGGTGRLMFYILSSGAAAGSFVVALLAIAGHIQ